MSFLTPEQVRKGRDEAHAKMETHLETIDSRVRRKIEDAMEDASRSAVYSSNVAVRVVFSGGEEGLLGAYAQSERYERLGKELTALGWKVEILVVEGTDSQRDGWQDGHVSVELRSPLLNKA